MSKWKMVKLGDIFDLQMGKTPSRNNKEYWNDGSNKWVSISDLSLSSKYIKKTKETITDLAVKESGIKIVPKDSVIMSFKLSLGKTSITSEEIYTNEAIMAFLDKKTHNIYNDFIYYVLKYKNWSEDTNKAVMGATLNKAILTNIKISIPPLDVQKHIADMLDKTQEIIDGHKKRLYELDNLIKAIFYDMFGDPVINEKGWKKKRLSEVCGIVTGNTPPRNDKSNYGGYIEWIKSDNITSNNTYLTEATELLSEKGLKIGRSSEKDTILMTCIAGSIRCIGNVAIANRKVSFNQQINAIIPLKNNVYYLYILFLQTQKYIQSTINMSLKGILSKGKLSNLEFIIPPIELQNKFAQIVTKIEEQKNLEKQAISESENLFNSLMSKYFD